jgi:uncharacterized phage-like protein YoqJ
MMADVRREVRVVLDRGDGIITGGALGADYAATEVVLEIDPRGRSLKVILPTTLEIYAAHYRQRAIEGVITSDQAESLIMQLNRVKELGSLIENSMETAVNKTTYYMRNQEVVNASDEILAFIVNDSAGTQDTIDKAKAAGKGVQIFSYSI